MKKKFLLPIVCCIHFLLNAQTITSVEYSINWLSATQATAVPGKGIYMLVKEGLVLFDPVTTKYKLFNQTDSNKVVSELTGLAAHKDKVVVHSGTKMYLLSNDKLKDITPNYPFGGYAILKFVSINDNEIATTNGEKIFSYQNNTWKDMNVPGLRYSKLSKVFPGFKNYLVVNEASGELSLYDPEKNTVRSLARTYQSPIIFVPGQALWFMDNTLIHYFSLSNKMLYGLYEVGSYPGKLKENGFSKERYFDGCRLTLSDKKEILFLSSDTALQLTVSAPVDSTVKILLQKASYKPASASFQSDLTAYNNTLYQTGTTGIVRRTLQKTDTLYKLVNRSSGLEGYNMFMSNGYLYTRDAMKLHWNNGTNGGTKDFNKYVLDMTTDGKINYVLTETILYKERSLGVFDTMANAGENKMSAVAIDKNGMIWMAGAKGITTISKGKVDFVPAASISNFPPNKAVHDIALSPEGEVYISLDKVYKYKDKQLIEIPGTPSLVYRHLFDGKGNDYMARQGECFFYDGKEAKDLKKILQEAYPDKRNIYVGATAIDPQGRCWAIVNNLKEKFIAILDKGKPVNIIADGRIILDAFKQRIFANKQQMILPMEKGGWITIGYK